MKIFSLFLWLCCWAGLLAAQTKPVLRVLSIGLGTYKDARLNVLYADKDAHTVADALRGQGNTLYNKVEVHTLVNEQATTDNIFRQLKTYQSKAMQGDMLLVFFAGQGWLTEEQDAFALLPYDFEEDRSFSTILRGSDLAGLLHKGAGNVMMVVDAGYWSCADRRGGKALSDPINQALSLWSNQMIQTSNHEKGKQQAFLAIAPASLSERVCKSCQQGYFAQLLLETITNHPSNAGVNPCSMQDDLITKQECMTYMSVVLPILSGGGGDQQVWMGGFSGVDFPLFNAPAHRQPQPQPQPNPNPNENTKELNYKAFVQKGDAYYSSQNWAKAEACYEMALDFKPADTYCMDQLVECKLAQKQKDNPQPLPNPNPQPNPLPNPPIGVLDIAMVYVEGGSFAMGCVDGQPYCQPDDQPIRNVSVGNFNIGQFEITQAQWRLVMGSNPPQLAFGGCDNCPVEGVSWDDAQAFIEQLNLKTGKKYRLPTEAEWEYAARGGKYNHGYLHAGGNDPHHVAWYQSNSDDKTHPVGGKQPNELGIYDMTGNVGEWCSDWLDTYSLYPKHNPQGATSGKYKVARGGSWNHDAEYCGNARRGGNTPDHHSFSYGFRVVLPQF